LTAWFKELTKGIISANPVLVLALGLCPALAVTTSLEQALGLSAAVSGVLLASSLVVSLIRRLIPDSVRLPVVLIIVAACVSVTYMLFQTYFPGIQQALGIYLPLIAAYCIVLTRVEGFAVRNTVLRSLADALGIAVGFALALILIAAVREVLGTGGINLFNNQLFAIPGLSDSPVYIFVLPAGAFLAMGLLLALLRRTGVIKHE
jgi:electron transport complex protein RnfE